MIKTNWSFFLTPFCFKTLEELQMSQYSIPEDALHGGTDSITGPQAATPPQSQTSEIATFQSTESNTMQEGTTTSLAIQEKSIVEDTINEEVLPTATVQEQSISEEIINLDSPSTAIEQTQSIAEDVITDEIPSI